MWEFTFTSKRTRLRLLTTGKGLIPWNQPFVFLMLKNFGSFFAAVAKKVFLLLFLHTKFSPRTFGLGWRDEIGMGSMRVGNDDDLKPPIGRLAFPGGNYYGADDSNHHSGFGAAG